MVVANLSLAMAILIMEMVLLAIAMLVMEAKVLQDVAVVATPKTHLLPLEVRAIKVVPRCTVALSVRTRSSPHLGARRPHYSSSQNHGEEGQGKARHVECSTQVQSVQPCVPDKAGTQFPHDECVHPHLGSVVAVAKENTFEVIGINNIGAVVDDPFNTMGWWFLAASSILTVLALRPRYCTSHLKEQWLWLAIL
jgi:hypothetical protein